MDKLNDDNKFLSDRTVDWINNIFGEQSPDDVFDQLNVQRFDDYEKEKEIFDQLFTGKYGVLGDEKYSNECLDILAYLYGTKYGESSEHAKKEIIKINNPFESIGNYSFTTRSGIKFAEIDELIDFSHPLNANGESILHPDDPILNYANITNCFFDHGFTEYFQWRNGSRVKGFTFDFPVCPVYLRFGGARFPESPLQQQVRGFITDPGIVDEFVKFVRSKRPQGVHLVCSDGLVLIDRTSLNVRMQMISNCLLSLELLGDNGTLIFKKLDSFGPFGVGMDYLMRICFRQMAYVKPITSRPGSTETYLVFQGKLSGTDKICAFLRQRLENLRSLEELSDTNDADLARNKRCFVPAAALQNDPEFRQYLGTFNDRHCHLMKAVYLGTLRYMQNNKRPQFSDNKLAQMRRYYMSMWNLPPLDERDDPERFAFNALGNWLQVSKDSVTPDEAMVRFLEDIKTNEPVNQKWHFLPVYNKGPTIFMVQTTDTIYQWHRNDTNNDDSGSWKRCTTLDKVGLKAGTIIYGELATVYYRQRNFRGTSGDIMVAAHQHETLHIHNVLFYDCAVVTGFKRLNLALDDILSRCSSDAVAATLVRRRLYDFSTFVRDTRTNWFSVSNSSDDIGTDRPLFVRRDGPGNVYCRIEGLAFINEAEAFQRTPSLLWSWRGELKRRLVGLQSADPLHFSSMEKILPRRRS